MNFILGIVMGMLGLFVGVFIPSAARRVIVYKYKQIRYESAMDRLFENVLVRAGIAGICAAGWTLIGFYAGNRLSAVLLGLIWALAVMISVVDIKVHMIPNESALILAVLGLLFQFSCFGVSGLLSAFFAMVAVMLVFIMLAGFMGFGVVGAGDVKLAGAMGLVLGYPHIIYGMIGMGILLAAYCGIGLLTKKLSLKSMFTFAPFLMTGMAAAIVAILLGC